MTKEEYFKVSADKKLTPRCPCLFNCSRYRFTAFYVGQTCYKIKSEDIEVNMKNMGIMRENESLQTMLEAGEPITFCGGSRNFFIGNACPEFFLHSHPHKFSEMGSVATHQFNYDENFKGSKFRPGESRHYTECPEYSLSLSKRTKGRTRIPKEGKVRAELQKEISSKCPFCRSADVGHFEIHHIDEDPNNHAKDNLLLLCPTCHSKISKGDISKEEVLKVKRICSSNE